MGIKAARSDPAFALMLACAKGLGEDRCSDADLREASRRFGGDWDLFAELLDRHHMLLPASIALKRAGIELSANLNAAAQQQQMRALRLCARSLQLLDDLAHAGIDAVLLKGPVLSQQIFGDPAIRHSTDIDILIDWEQFHAAIVVLEGLGLELHGNRPPQSSWRGGQWRELAKDVTLLDRQSGFAIELHHRLKSPAALLPDLGIDDATETLAMSGRSLRVFSRDDLFVYLCAHGATSLWDRLKWLADIRAMIEGLDNDAIAQLQDHSHRHGTERCSALALLLIHDLWGRDLPQSLLDLRMADPVIEDLLRASHKRLHGDERRHSSIANTFARRHLARLRKDKAYRKALRREFLYDRELLERYPLSKRTRWLYFPLRLMLFAKRKLGIS